jgi:capsular polysaccharide biosynthesis protein
MQNSSEFNLLDIVRVAYRKRKTILYITLFALVASIIVAMVMPVYYKSSSLFYPTNLSQSDRSSIFSEKQSEGEFKYYGGKHDANRILTLAYSGKIVDFAINYFDLAKHYGYDTAKESYWRTNVKKEFLENFSVIKTDKDAIEITLYDTDRELCAKMVNTIVEKLDEHSKEPIRINKIKVLKMVQTEVTNKEKEQKSITESLIALKNSNSINVSGTAENVNITGGNTAAVEEYKMLYAKQQNNFKDLQELSNILAQYQVASNDDVSALSILEPAFPAEKKSKPVRWVIVAIGTLLGLVFAIIAAFLVEVFPSIKSKVVGE